MISWKIVKLVKNITNNTSQIIWPVCKYAAIFQNRLQY